MSICILPQIIPIDATGSGYAGRLLLRTLVAEYPSRNLKLTLNLKCLLVLH
ncbi:hypothetical protein ALC53_05882 [Atta colombica]|uniref:Uncharacterized protein n=1 Tax=Atta colombica TaxID=520822 RepID=A0A151I362_9HYME|nr:hypothetical protein ALC53_05882 [Atta colombica]